MVLPDWTISEVTLDPGVLGIGPIPGRSGRYEEDLSALLRWSPDLVLTMTPMVEMERIKAEGLGDDLAATGVNWRHVPVADFGAPDDISAALWPDVSNAAHMCLSTGGKVFVHCFGGCGRSGMALLRLMVEAGEDVDRALARLRDARPCAVETDVQLAWAAIPMFERKGWTP